MATNPEPELDPRAWWPLWELPAPEMVITCECGADVTLARPRNVCHCGRTWNQWGRQLYDRCPPEP